MEINVINNVIRVATRTKSKFGTHSLVPSSYSKVMKGIPKHRRIGGSSYQQDDIEE